MAVKSLTHIGSNLASRMVAVPTNAFVIGTMGAFIGGIAATAANTYKVAAGELSKTEAAKNVAQDTLGTGLAAAAGATTTTVLGLSGIVGLTGLVVVTTLAKGAWDRALSAAD
jgi:hypothetical protein